MGNKSLRIYRAGVAATLILLIGLSGCTDNPLIGDWDIVDKRQAVNGLVCRNMEFTPEREICDGLVIGIEYDVTEGGVIISQSAENPMFDIGIKIEVLSKDLISYRDPISGKKIHYRRKGTAAYSPVVRKLLESYNKDELLKSCNEGLENALKYGGKEQAQKAVDSVCLAASLK